MPALDEVASEKLQAMAAENRLRHLREARRGEGATILRGGKTLISFACNDYCGLSQHERVRAAAAEAAFVFGAGSGASRLVTGSYPLYAALERRLATWKGAEAALVFGSGYLANIGIVPALMSRGDLILADKLVHACLIDGARLSGATFVRFAHNDAGECARILAAQRGRHRHALIITDEIFSMDGDHAPMQGLKDVAGRYDAWLMADGAHTIVPGAIKADIMMGTLSKALGSYGGYVAGSAPLIGLLASAARSFVFSTGLPPAAIAAADTALAILMESPLLAQMPLEKARLFTRTLGLPDAQSPIVPLILGEEARALAASQALESAGYAVSAIRPPTVPEGTSRLRFTFSALHRDEDILSLAREIQAQGWI